MTWSHSLKTYAVLCKLAPLYAQRGNYNQVRPGVESGIEDNEEMQVKKELGLKSGIEPPADCDLHQGRFSQPICTATRAKLKHQNPL
jgi:hypothetical protein